MTCFCQTLSGVHQPLVMWLCEVSHINRDLRFIWLSRFWRSAAGYIGEWLATDGMTDGP